MALRLGPRYLGSSSVPHHMNSSPLGYIMRTSFTSGMKPRYASLSAKRTFISTTSNTMSRPSSSMRFSLRASPSIQLSSRRPNVYITSSRYALLFRKSSSGAEHSPSSTASRFSPVASSTTPASAIPKGSPTTLTWNEYLALRTRRRRINVLFSAACGLSTMAMGATVIAAQDLDNLNAFSFGLDPMIVLGAATLACGMIGWLLGPFLGGAVFGLMYRRVGSAMREKERDLFQRIKRYRSDPTGQSVSNPVPDYYGEKISSVQGYRRWLKDQRAFRKKREVDVI